MNHTSSDFDHFLRVYQIEGFQHETYPDVTEAIREGDVERIEAIDWQRYCRFGVGRMSDDPVVQARFLLISADSMAMTIAFEMGVDGETLMSLCDYYAQLSQKTSKTSEIYDLVGQSMLHICRIVRKFRELPKSRIIRQVSAYVEKNMAFPFRLVR